MLIDSVFYRVFIHDTLLTKHSYLPAFKQTEKYVQVVTCNFTSKVRDRTMSRKKKQWMAKSSIEIKKVSKYENQRSLYINSFISHQ